MEYRTQRTQVLPFRTQPATVTLAARRAIARAHHGRLITEAEAVKALEGLERHRQGDRTGD